MFRIRQTNDIPIEHLYSPQMVEKIQTNKQKTIHSTQILSTVTKHYSIVEMYYLYYYASAPMEGGNKRCFYSSVRPSVTYST